MGVSSKGQPGDTATSAKIPAAARSEFDLAGEAFVPSSPNPLQPRLRLRAHCTVRGITSSVDFQATQQAERWLLFRKGTVGETAAPLPADPYSKLTSAPPASGFLLRPRRAVTDRYLLQACVGCQNTSFKTHPELPKQVVLGSDDPALSDSRFEAITSRAASLLPSCSFPLLPSTVSNLKILFNTKFYMSVFPPPSLSQFRRLKEPLLKSLWILMQSK